ncbi:MAG: polyprenol phosphomannose-dependent alpha 1,6 mannosyltransferase MptB [Acidimicrobiales bacterium]
MPSPSSRSFGVCHLFLHRRSRAVMYAYVAYGEMAAADSIRTKSVPSPSAMATSWPPSDGLCRRPVGLRPGVHVDVDRHVAAIAQGNVVASVVLYRVLGLFGLLLAAIALWDITRRLGRDPIDALMLGPLNPVVLYHLVSGAHNEAIMLGFLMLGVAIGRRPGMIHAGVVVCALSAAIKIPGLLGAVFVVWPWAMAATTPLRRLSRSAW